MQHSCRKLNSTTALQMVGEAESRKIPSILSHMCSPRLRQEDVSFRMDLPLPELRTPQANVPMGRLGGQKVVKCEPGAGREENGGMSICTTASGPSRVSGWGACAQKYRHPHLRAPSMNLILPNTRLDKNSKET